MNGSRPATRSTKRKAPASPDHAPPPKRGAVNGNHSDDDVEYVEYEEYEYDEPSEIMDAAAMVAATPGTLGEWRDTIQNVVRSVVSIRFCQTCSFDTDPALTSEATGFVVDSERG